MTRSKDSDRSRSRASSAVETRSIEGACLQVQLEVLGEEHLRKAAVFDEGVAVVEAGHQQEVGDPSGHEGIKSDVFLLGGPQQGVEGLVFHFFSPRERPSPVRPRNFGAASGLRKSIIHLRRRSSRLMKYSEDASFPAAILRPHFVPWPPGAHPVYYLRRAGWNGG